MRKLISIPFLITIAFQTSFAFQQDSLKNVAEDTSVLVNNCNILFDSARFYSQKDLKKSIYFGKKALEIALQANNDRITAETKSLLGTNYIKIGASAEALDFFIDALDYYDKTNNEKDHITTLKKIGDLLWYNGKFKEALEYYEEFGQYATTINDTQSIILSLNAKGAVYGNINNFDTAISLFNQALKMSLSINDDYLEMYSRFNIADALLFSGKPHQAIIKFYEIINETKRNHKTFLNYAGLYNSLARANLYTKDYKVADKYNQQSLKLAKEANLLYEIRNYYEVQYKIDSSLTNYQNAFTNHLKLKQYSDSINNIEHLDNLSNFKLVYDLKKRQMEVEKLQLENEIGQSQLKRNRYFLFTGIIVILLLLALFINIYRSKKVLNNKNKKLDEQKEELETILEKLKQTQAQLLQSEKMASLGIFTTGIAHEINNPLNYINGGIHILEDVRSDFDPENIHEFREKFNLALKMVEDGFNKSSSIVKSLMSFATRESKELEKHNLTTILNNTLIFLKPQLENITVETDYIENDELLIYPDKLHQVIINVFDNAIKALADIEEKKIKVVTYKNKKSFAISIQNNGPKISKKHLDRLFDPFFTTRQPGEGVGMGLTISYNLIKEHKGEINARNLKDGVEFTIELPLQH